MRIALLAGLIACSSPAAPPPAAPVVPVAPAPAPPVAMRPPDPPKPERLAVDTPRTIRDAQHEYVFDEM